MKNVKEVLRSFKTEGDQVRNQLLSKIITRVNESAQVNENQVAGLAQDIGTAMFLIHDVPKSEQELVMIRQAREIGTYANTCHE